MVVLVVLGLICMAYAATTLRLRPAAAPDPADPSRIPGVIDLRAYDMHGLCHRLGPRGCGRNGLVHDVHFASCPHQAYSDSLTVLEWR